MNSRRLYRSAYDRILAGVAGGVAAYFDVDPVIVRVIWFLSVFFSGSLTLPSAMLVTNRAISGSGSRFPSRLRRMISCGSIAFPFGRTRPGH